MSTLRRRMMLLAVGNTPTTMIPYIRGGADGSYIDTGIVPDNTTRIVLWARNFNIGCDFVCGSSSGNNRFRILGPQGGFTGEIRVDFGSNANTYVNDKMAFGDYHKFELNRNEFYIDDVLKATCLANTFTGTLNMHLFGLHNNGSHLSPATDIDICACKIYKNDVLVRDFTPVDSPSVGFYDSVSDTVFTNAGSGSLTFGTFNPDAYERIEYITCSGEQYFDTGAYGSYYGPIRVYIQPANDSAGYPIGYRGSSDWVELGILPEGSAKRVYFRLAADSNFYTLYNSTTSLAGNDIIMWKGATSQAYLNKNFIQIRTVTPSAATTYTSSGTIYVGCRYHSNPGTGESNYQRLFSGKIYNILLPNRNFVPALVNNVAGMYDTYNDQFYPSISGTAFVAGPTA